MTHVAFETLIDYLDNRLDPKLHTRVAAHLQACVECQQLLTSAQRLPQSANESDSAGPSPALMRRAIAAFRHSRQRTAHTSHSVVTCLFDSWDGRLPMGIRGHAEERQLLYRFADVDIDLQITPNRVAAPDNTILHSVHGQILHMVLAPERLEGIAVKLVSHAGGEAVRGTMVDDLGRFNFSLVSAANYTLQIDLDDATVRIEELTLGAV